MTTTEKKEQIVEEQMKELEQIMCITEFEKDFARRCLGIAFYSGVNFILEQSIERVKAVSEDSSIEVPRSSPETINP